MDTITESNTETTHGTIRTPLPLLLRRVRYQLVPILTLVTCLVLSSWLWVRRGGSVTAIGAVSSLQINVNSKVDGLLVGVASPEWAESGRDLADLPAGSAADVQAASVRVDIQRSRHH